MPAGIHYCDQAGRPLDKLPVLIGRIVVRVIAEHARDNLMGLLMPWVTKSWDELDRRPTVARADIPKWREVRIGFAEVVFQRLNAPLRRDKEVAKSRCDAGVLGEIGRNIRRRR